MQNIIQGLLALGTMLAMLTIPVPGKAQSGCLQLVWADEFETAGAPDASRWNFETGGGGWGNNELQYYTNTLNNSYISGGTLKIHAKKSNGTWTSARMVTSGKASWKYGRIEIKAKLPAGKGTWPALWMMPQQSVYGGWPTSGEIDIMEHVGYDLGRIYGTAHTEAYNHKIGTQKGGNVLISNVNTEFHIYSIEWTETQIRWFVDENLYFTFVNEKKTYKEWPFDQPFFLIFNLAIGGDWGGAQGIDPNLAEAVMEIDYVHVYSTSIPKPGISGTSLATSGQQITFSTPQLGQLQYKWTLPDGVTVVSGAGTNVITVKWNDKPGQITVEAYNVCDTVASSPFQIGIQSKPTGEYWQIPFLDTGNKLLWGAVAGANNQITMRFENGELVVTFNIQNPGANPYIFFSLPSATDLTSYREILVQLMALAGAAPYNIRIDLPDINGQNDTNDLFKIENPADDGKFHIYQKTFTMSTASGWQPSKIAQVVIYFNYGIFGKTGTGEFRIKDLKMHDPNFTSASFFPSREDVRLFPNPAGDRVEITAVEPFNTVTVTSVSGQVLKRIISKSVVHQIISLQDLSPGIYVVTVYSEGNPTVNFKMLKNN